MVSVHTMSTADAAADSKFRCRSDKQHGRHEGKIFLKNAGVVFVSNDESYRLNLPYEWIKGLKTAAKPILLQILLYPGKHSQDSVLFDFSEYHDTHNKLSFTIGHAPPPPKPVEFPKGGSGERDRDRFTALLRRDIQPIIDKRSLQEPSPQERMLRDKVLRETYEAVVISGIMEDEAFWRHRHEAKLQEDINLQRRGVPSAKTDIKELTSDQQFIRYSVSRADEEQYFQQHPTLRNLYDTEVGSGRMTRQQFWTAFLEFSVIKQHTNISLSPEYNLFDQFEGKDSAEAKRRFEEACSRNADTSVAITPDAFDIFHGIYENSVSHCTLEKELKSNEQMHKINRDSVGVMLSLNISDAEPSSKRARLVDRQVLDCIEIGLSGRDGPVSSHSAGDRELIFPPISISSGGHAVSTFSESEQHFSIVDWMSSSKKEKRILATLESDLKSLVSVQFEVISSFWLNFPPAIDDVSAVKRCFRLSKALRDQWDKLIAFASKPPYEVELGSLHRRVLEHGFSCIDQSSCRFAMVFYRQFLCINRAMCCFKNWSDRVPEQLRQAIIK